MEAFFLPAAHGQRFCLLHRPTGDVAPRGGLVFAPALGEENNCSRRSVALQARALAAAGYSVLHIDLFGSGDSSGDFANARWADWQADLHLACDHLHTLLGQAPGLWGLRTGALLAAQVAAERHATPALLLWQAVWSGEAMLRHLLRLHLTSEKLAGREANTTRMREQLAQGDALTIAGYTLSPTLADDLEAVQWPSLPATLPIACLEAGSQASAEAQRRQAGQPRMRLLHADSPAFWQSPGLTLSPEWQALTTTALGDIWP